MSDFYKVVILDWIAGRLQIGPKLSPVNINNTVWITCNFFDDVRVGNKSIALLTATPIEMTSAKIVNVQYVPVNLTSFNSVRMRLMTNYITQELYTGAHKTMLVLHFVPQYKRRMIDALDEVSKKICQHGSCGNVLLGA